MTYIFTKALIFLHRCLCRLYTVMRHPLLHGTPALLLRYETSAQQEAYHHLSAERAWHDELPKIAHRLLVIIPFRDKWSMTEMTLKSLILQQQGVSPIMVALVDNGSIEPETEAGIQHWLKCSSDRLIFRHLRYDIPFNFSRLNNLAVKDCADFAAPHILFLNNDVKLLEPTTFLQMQNFMDKTSNCGSVGCTLLYPDMTIQHLFIFVGCKIVGSHPFKGKKFNNKDPWYHSPRPVGAATAAILMVRSVDFFKVCGFNEQLPSCYQDVDLALKMQIQGKVNWVMPGIQVIHYETQTRDPVHSWDEVDEMFQKWGIKLTRNQFITTRFSRWSERIALTLGEGDYPWRWLR